MNDGAKVLVVGDVATVVLGRGQKRIVSWDRKVWGPLVSAGFVRVLDVWDDPTGETVAEPATEKPEPVELEPVAAKPRRTRNKKAPVQNNVTTEESDG